MKIIPGASTTLAAACLVLFMGVNSVNISMDFTLENTDTTTNPFTSVILEVRITNRIYKNSLTDPESVECQTLKLEMEDLFAYIFEPTPLAYLRTEDMIFSNGSVIASSRLLFGMKPVDPVLVRSIFLSTYTQIPSPDLEIDLNYTENDLTNEGLFEEVEAINQTPTTLHTSSSTTTTTLTSSPDITMTTTLHPSTSISITSTTFSTDTFNSTSHINATYPTTLTRTSDSPSSTTEDFKGTTIRTTNGFTTKTPSKPSSGTDSKTSSYATAISSSSALLHEPYSFVQNTTDGNLLTSAAAAELRPAATDVPLVPGWAVVLLLLVAVCVFLLLILLFVLVVLWCCCPKRGGFLNEHEELSPPMYFNADIPMYSTQTTFDTTGGKQADVTEKPQKNRTGMYVVNK